MKKNLLFVLSVIFGFTLLFSSCSESLNNTGDDLALIEKKASLNNGNSGGCDFSAVLSENEINGLLQMREEEKVARDAYLTFYNMYKDRVFSNIAQSEQSHMDAVLNLIKGYGLTDPAYTDIGKFTPAFQTIYDQLIARGIVSLKEAILVGIDIEKMDIADLNTHIAETSVPNILQVYNNLLAGSYNHLSAFNTRLSRLK